MIRTLTVAALMATFTGSAFAQTTVTETTDTVVTYGVIEGDGLEMATREQTTVTSTDSDFVTNTETTTETSTADYDRYFDQNGNPIYLPDVTFALD